MRTDFTLYSESSTIYLASEGLHGRTHHNVLSLAQGTEDLLRMAMKEGLFLPLLMAEEGALPVRVVVGDLAPDEEREWTGGVSWFLRVPDGRLALSGGLSLFQRDLASDLVEDYIQVVDVPPGDYRCRAFTYLPGATAFANLEKTALKSGFETVGEYFRRTRPDTDFPLWLREHCVEYSEADPGHEGEWANYAESLDEAASDALYSARERFIELVVQLTPTQTAPDRFPFLEFGACDWETRKPELCPLGLPRAEE